MSFDNFIFLLNWYLVFVGMCLALANLKKAERYDKPVKISTCAFIVLGVIGSTFCIIASDYYGYKKTLNRLSIWGVADDFEPIYWYFCNYVKYNIFIFRGFLLLVYYALMAIIIKQFRLSQTITYSIALIFIFLPVASLIRSSLADAFMWCGIIFFFRNRNFRFFLMMILFMAVGIVLHKSSFMMVLLLMAAYIKPHKALIQFSIVSLPLSIIIVRFIVPLIFARFFASSTYVESHVSSSFIGLTKNIVSIVFDIFFYIFILCKVRPYCKDNFAQKMYSVVYLAFYVKTAFMFSGASRFIGERLFAHATIPVLYLLTLLFIKANKRIMQKLLVYLIIYILILQLGILVVWAYHKPVLLTNQYI